MNKIVIKSGKDLKLRKFRHKSVLERMLICFFLTLMREILYIGYLFLIGAEQGLVTVMRMLLCAAYSALMILPGSVIMRLIMRAGRKKKKGDGDLNEDDVVTETQR